MSDRPGGADARRQAASRQVTKGVDGSLGRRGGPAAWEGTEHTARPALQRSAAGERLHMNRRGRGLHSLTCRLDHSMGAGQF
jgi:hypothetical protein